MDNGPVAKSAVFQRVMLCLGIKVKTHEPRKEEKIAERTTSRSKCKVERPFLTVKCAHEALYHLGHVPKTEIGYRTAPYSLDGAIDSRRQFIEWLLEQTVQEGVAITDVFEQRP